MTSRRARLATLGLGLATALALGVTGPAAAEQQRFAVVEPTVIPDENNPGCEDVQNGFVGEIDVAPQDDTDIPVTSEDGTLTGTLDVDFSDDLLTLENFNFDGELVAGAVIVKGGNAGNLYDYRPLGGIAEDDDLIAPTNEGGQQPQISHVTFCFLPADGS
ncbi:hypothetical protein ACF08N_00365 [Streptomyces sp. NPDC015127]|uniref:hypothetical protein n=1 Tax=Streptomyces sp. NPDC015127 TaxID=3364939 RepID=UPI0036FA1B1A